MKARFHRHRFASPSPAEIGTAVTAYWAEAKGQPDHAAVRQLRGTAAREFESALARFVGKRFCVTQNSATNALLAVALAAPFPPGEIITTPCSFGGTWGPFIHCGHRLRFGRVDRRGNLIPASVAALVNDRSRAVVAVDHGGFPHDSAGMREACDRHGLFYIADAAASLGTFLSDGRHASHAADALIVSFGPRKPLFCGEGGAILTDHASLYRALVRLTQHPDRSRWEFSLADEADIQPVGSRIHPVAALVGLLALRGNTVPP